MVCQGVFVATKDVWAHHILVTVDTPNGRAPPLITGTFGSADFFHSLLGEATDKLSQSSVTDLSAKLNDVSRCTSSCFTIFLTWTTGQEPGSE